MAKSKEEIVQTLLAQFTDACTESELKEGFLWSRVRKAQENGNEKLANEFKMKVAALKQARQDEYEAFIDYLNSPDILGESKEKSK